MTRRSRVTGPLLDVAACLLRADVQGEQPHGWMIMKETKRSGPTVYGVLDRLEDRSWIEGYWEEQDPGSSRPRRRFYRLTPQGAAGLHDLLAERRPVALPRPTAPGRGAGFPVVRPVAPDGAG
jgi:DNA-binding PadR family transcriptional regulator